jgi:hypothetical protein
MAKAFLIAPQTQTIEEVSVDGTDDIAAAIGYATLESDEVGSAGDRLYFDEECFIRGTPGRFQIDALIPVAGKGVVVGVSDDGVTLRDPATTLEELRARTVFK